MARKVQKHQSAPIQEARVVLPGESRVLSILGSTLTLYAVGEDTGGALALIEYTVPPRFSGQPLHYHAHTQEVVYVLEGTLTVGLGKETLEAPSGSFVLIPPNQVHNLINRSGSPARFLVLSSPAGLEGYFEELAGLVAREPTWPPADFEKLEALAGKYDQHKPEEPSQ